jgi:flagellar protein FlaJ
MMKNKGPKISVQLPNIHYVGYRILGDFPSRFFPLTGMLKASLERAHMRMSYIVYVSSMIFWGIVALLASAAIGTPLILTLNTLLNLQLQTLQLIEYLVGIPLAAMIIVIVIFMYYPMYKADAIKNELDKNLVYIVNFMGILAGSGMTTEDIFSALADTGKTYKVAESAESVVRDIGLFGKDIITAMDAESEITPSKKYSKVLVGLLGINKSGGDLKQYFAETAEHEMEVRRRELTGIVNKLGLAAEIYTTVGIAFPIILIVLLSLMGIFGGEVAGGLGPVQIMTLMTYLLFPLMSVGVILLIDGMTSNW